jgi:response regulator RpfG family c-di-GMP phosphodiesterase
MIESRKKTILAVDDTIAVLTTIRTILEGVFEVCLAKSTDIAMTVLNTTEIDMILLDMEMPGVSGIEFLKELQRNPSFYYIPVIIVSSHGTPDVIIEAKKAGARDFVVKPIAPKILLDKIHTVLKTSPKKINHDVLVRKLALLETACRQGKSFRVEELVGELEQVHHNINTDGKIAETCKYAMEMEYNLAIENIKKLLSSMNHESCPF